MNEAQLCLLDLARGIWQRRGASKAARLPISEETVTENLLLDLYQKYPGEVTIVPFTKPLEGKTGADWAWSFESSDGKRSFPMLVQAKALDHRDHEYPEIGRFIGRSKTTPRKKQIDQLIDTAKKLNFPAIYAFYNHLVDESRVPNNCRSMAMVGSPMPDSWGVSLARAEDVAASLADQTFDTHRKHSMPLHCLLCSQGTGRDNPGGSPLAIARSPLSVQVPRSGRPRGPGPSEDGTWHDRHIIFDLAYEASLAETPDGESTLTGRLRKQFPKVAGVVIVRDAPPKD
ncbi:DUF6615 family protein [Agrobacterium tumefaciens]|uniref:DUF6615 family protein n=1 Tax=Agrobacterium tumefaciens TaxID=358 RepID=UPI003BA2EC59